MKRIIAIILILALLLIASPASAASSIEIVDRGGDGTWIGNTWEVNIYPGEMKATTLTLYNSSNSSSEVEVTIVPDSLDGGNLTFELDRASFTMSGRSYADVILSVKASGSATPGTYTAELRIEAVSSPPPGGEGAPTTYYIETSLFGQVFKYRISRTGKILKTIEFTSEDGMLTITIPRGTVALDKDDKRLRRLLVAVDESPPDPPQGTHIIGLAYSFDPDGATFDPAITLTWSYNPDALLKGVAEEDLVLAYYDEEVGEWLQLDGVVDTVGNTITAKVSHFSAFAILGYLAAPEPAAFTISKLMISPTEVDIGQSVTISAIVTNTGGEAGSYKVAFKINAVVEATEEVMVSAGASKKVTFTTAKDVAGSYSVDVNGLSDSFTIVERPPVYPTAVPPPTPPAKAINWWWLIGGIIAAIALGVNVLFFVARKRAETKR